MGNRLERESIYSERIERERNFRGSGFVRDDEDVPYSMDECMYVCMYVCMDDLKLQISPSLLCLLLFVF